MPYSPRHKFSRGDRVEGRFGGGQRWYLGRISCVNRNGSYDVKYDDGDFEQDVEENLLRNVGNSDSDTATSDRAVKFRKGQRVEARFGGGRKYYKGTVKVVVRNGCDIDYDDGDFEKAVSFDLIKAIDDDSPRNHRLSKQNSRSRSKSRSVRSFKDFSDNESVDLRSRSKSKSKHVDDDFQVGDKVKARFQGKSAFYTGVIKRKNRDGTYAIDYDDGDREAFVEANLIQPLKGTTEGSKMNKSFRSTNSLGRRKSTRMASERDSMSDHDRSISDNVNHQYCEVMAKILQEPDGLRNLRRELKLADVSYEGAVSSFGFSKALKAIGISPTFSETKEVQREFPSQINKSKIDYKKFLKALEANSKENRNVRSPSVRNSSKENKFQTLLRKYGREGWDLKMIRKCKNTFSDEADGNSISLRQFLVIIGRFSQTTWSRAQTREIANCFLHESRSSEVMFKKFLKEMEQALLSGDTTDDSQKKFNVGDVVEAKFGGGSKFYRGKIVKVHGSGRCDISYDDGDDETFVKPDQIKLISRAFDRSNSTKNEKHGAKGSQDIFIVGDIVEAKFGGGSRYYKGTVMKVHKSGRCDIHYDDGDDETFVKPDIIRLISRESLRRSPRSARKKSHNAPKDLLNEGDTVEARFGGGSRSYKGTIVKVHADDFYDIDYVDGDYEKRVERGLIKLIKSNSLKNDIKVGDKVMSPFQNSRKKFAGEVTKVNKDHTLNIEFDDGDREKFIDADKVEPIQDNRASFRVGDPVEAKFGGGSKYFMGKIDRVNANGTYDVDYDDGDYEKNVSPKLIQKLKPKKSHSSRARTPYSAGSGSLSRSSSASREHARSRSKSSFAKGDKIEGRFKGGSQYIAGKVIRVHGDGNYDVEYKNGRTERRINSEMLREERIKSHSAGSSSPRVSRKSIKNDDSFKVGDRVEARFGNGKRYFKGTIRRVHRSGFCDIDYDDGDHEKKVGNDLIRLLPKSSPRITTSARSRSKAKADIQVGDKVLWPYRKSKKKFPGEVRKINDEKETVNILFEDGAREKDVAIDDLEKASVEKDDSSDSSSFSDGLRKESATDSAAEGKSPRAFEVGDKVEARYKAKAKYYKGTIKKVHPKSFYDIHYEDGDFELKVPAKLIKPQSKRKTSEAAKFEMGAKVLIPVRGKMLPGKVCGIRDNGEVDVKLTTGLKEKRVDPSKIKRANTTKPSSGSSVKVGDKVMSPSSVGKSSKLQHAEVKKVRKKQQSVDLLFEDGSKEKHVPMKNLKSRKDEKKGFDVGELIEAKYRGAKQYTKGTIVKAYPYTKTYEIKYEDGKCEKKVKEALIRKVKVLESSRSPAPSDGSEISSKTSDSSSEESSEASEKVKPKSPQSKPIRAGMLLKVKHEGQKVKGTVFKARSDGTFDLILPDGSKAKKVSPKDILLNKKERSMSPEVKAKELFSEQSSSINSSTSENLSSVSGLSDLKLNLGKMNSSASSTWTLAGNDLHSTDSSPKHRSTKCKKLTGLIEKAGSKLADIKELFKKADSKKSGTVPRKMFVKILKKFEIDLEARCVKEVMKQFGTPEDSIRYKLFVKSCKKPRDKSSPMPYRSQQDESFFFRSVGSATPRVQKSAQNQLLHEVKTNSDLCSFKVQFRPVIHNLRKKKLSPNSVFKDFDLDGNSTIGLSAFPLAMKKLGFKLDRAELYDFWKILGKHLKKGKSLLYKAFTKELIYLYNNLDTEKMTKFNPGDQDFKMPTKVDQPIEITTRPKTADNRNNQAFQDPDVLSAYNRLRSILSDALKNGLARDSVEIFYMFDLNQTGFINLVDMRKSLEKLGVPLPLEQIQSLVQLINLKNSSVVLPDMLHPNMIQISMPTFQAFLSSNDFTLETGSPRSPTGGDGITMLETQVKTKMIETCHEKMLDRTQFLDRFQRHDPNSLGFITLKSLKKIFFELKIRVSLEQLETIFARFSVANKEKFNYGLFVNFVFCNAKSIERTKQKLRKFIKSLLDRESTIHEVFNFFDKNSDGKISLKEMSKTLAGANVSVSESDIREVFRELDIDKDGFLGLTEFKFFFNKETIQTSSFFKERNEPNRICSRALNYESLQQDEQLPGTMASQKDRKENAIGRWLDTDASSTDKKNFFAFMNMVNSFERKLSKTNRISKQKAVENGEVVLPLGKKLKVAMRFLSS